MKCAAAIVICRRATCGYTSVSRSARKWIRFRCVGPAAPSIKFRTSVPTGSSRSKKVRARSMRRNTTSSHKKAHKKNAGARAEHRSRNSSLLLFTAPAALFLCVMCLFVATIRAQNSEVVQVFEQIATLIQNNQLPEAEKQLNAILRVSPDMPVALDLMGTIRAKQNRLLEAENLFLRAVKKDSKFTGARMNLAYLYLL